MPYNAALISFIETKLFSRLLGEYLSDDDYARLQEQENIPAHVLRKIKEEIDG
jgi:hypothetical protein